MKKVTTANRLKEALEAKGMKQTDLAEKSGLGRPAISQYLSGKIVPKQDKIYLLSQALNVDPFWLMGFDVSMGLINNAVDLDDTRLINFLINKPDVIALLKNYHSASKENKNLLLNISKAMNEK